MEIFFLGVIGAFTAFTSIVVLPQLQGALDGSLEHQKKHIVIAGIMVVFFMLSGGLVAWVLGDASEPKRAAFFYGAGWQAFAKGGGTLVTIAGSQLKGEN